MWVITPIYTVQCGEISVVILNKDDFFYFDAAPYYAVHTVLSYGCINGTRYEPRNPLDARELPTPSHSVRRNESDMCWYWACTGQHQLSELNWYAWPTFLWPENKPHEDIVMFRYEDVTNGPYHSGYGWGRTKCARSFAGYHTHIHNSTTDMALDKGINNK